MFKTKFSFVTLVVLVLTLGAYSFAGDIIYIIKRTLDERVAVLERKAALVDLYFADRGIDLERAYGHRVVLITEEEHCRRNRTHSGVDVRIGGVEVVVPIPTAPATPMSPRDAGRYFVSFKDGSKMVIVTFEKTKVYTNDFDRGRSSHEIYTFYLENGRKTTCSIKDVDDIKFIPYNRGEQ